MPRNLQKSMGLINKNFRRRREEEGAKGSQRQKHPMKITSEDDLRKKSIPTLATL